MMESPSYFALSSPRLRRASKDKFSFEETGYAETSFEGQVRLRWNYDATGWRWVFLGIIWTTENTESTEV